MDRRQFFRQTGRGTALTLLMVAPVAAQRITNTIPTTRLRDMLRVELEPRTPDELAYLERVVLMVKRRELPLSLVLRIFDWAREIEPYPFPYFQRALTIQAKRLGIVLDRIRYSEDQ